jgi:hypothetical protein
MSKSDAQREEPSTGEVNLLIFEELFGATRERLADDVCGLLHAGVMYGSFKGHDRSNDEEMWAEHYQGPNFCGDLVRMFEVEERLARTGLQHAYAETLALGVCPNYQRLKNVEEVLDFWYALAHASPVQRARAAGRVIVTEGNHV